MRAALELSQSIKPAQIYMHPSRQVKFPSLPAQWTPVTNVKALDRKGILAIELDSIPLVFFRSNGKVSALIDRCPHRSVKLSGGTITSEGCIQCPFHGWQYDGQGNCTLIALNDAPNLDAVKASVLPCQEVGGLLWVYTSTDTTSEIPLLNTPDSLAAAGWFGNITEREWDTHWSRATQTMLDVAHIPYVHPRTIGAAYGRALGKSQNPHLETTITKGVDGAFRLDWLIKADKNTESLDKGWLEFLPPNGLTLGIPTDSESKRSLLHIWCVPIAENRARMIVVSRRNFGHFNPILSLFNLLTPIILGEDRWIMETVSPSEVPPLGAEVLVPSDAPTIEFCRYYQAHFLDRRVESIDYDKKDITVSG